ncbi:LamB/YcsF family protein [Acidipropionibacterium acidipropionici ATCC 4875]|uniref:5-oxoprolinase subunit A n=1 Tax=Acidipropionibacterium acidipropionici (strain ATCC 4875 / DSM 20272 / JCM 6432 / NBRC 12425 / NCIMB 8070 / 4) TaxID=1171373 RepID=K7RR83_ACIA4|nr:5-oxoprolinase subunit PxpA [Acidipropionibacterium acidipropionici]AFV88816.1 LamB/YcsF family protein [Acidipropionibacterium acidipropionici ATCC 4875]
MDLNSDSGESFSSWRMGDDDAMMAIVTSANVACGFHAGDPSVMRSTITAAAANDVAVGAHVSYRDLAHFGRVFVDVAPNELINEVIYQIGALQAMAAVVGTRVRYVKPHGALYNTIVHHSAQAEAVGQAISEVDDSLAVLCQPGSEIARIAEKKGLRVVCEAFADRAYNPDGTLVSRCESGSVLHDPDEIAARVVRMATDHQVIAIDGTVVGLDAESVCVHGDTPGAVAIAAAVRSALADAGIEPARFT